MACEGTAPAHGVAKTVDTIRGDLKLFHQHGVDQLKNGAEIADRFSRLPISISEDSGKQRFSGTESMSSSVISATLANGGVGSEH
ncbi:MAG: hypothetical protein M2R45_00251 [Verrucomicrobia subdivision 3 bacterium]|nr:hypothetical protein [Limisphaerales bacterium]MCS1412989.1 hypothetical protein [Limisphaerales bacterium]